MRIRSSALVLCLIVAGCGGANPAPPRPISGAAKQIADVVERLGEATARRDYATICDRLFAASTRRQAGGADCASVLATRTRGLRHPRIVIKSIVLQGSRAQVQVRTTAAGQAPATDVIRLVRENGSYRVLSLGR